MSSAPWVHWPETMVTYLAEGRILFTCDFFGSHLATSDLYMTDEARVYEILLKNARLEPLGGYILWIRG